MERNGSGWGKWSACVLAPDGKLYGIPAKSGMVLQIDPDTAANGGITLIDTGLTQTDYNKYYSASVAADGKIYAVERYANDLMVIDTHSVGVFDTDVLLNGHINGQ